MSFNWATSTWMEIVASGTTSLALLTVWRATRQINGPGWWACGFAVLGVGQALALVGVSEASASVAGFAAAFSSIAHIILLAGTAHRIGFAPKPIWVGIFAVVTGLLAAGGQGAVCATIGPCAAIGIFHGLVAGICSGLFLYSAKRTKRKGEQLTAAVMALLCVTSCLSGLFAGSATNLSWTTLARSAALQLTGFALIGIVIERLIEQRNEEEETSARRRMTDPVTGVFTGRRFMQLANLEVQKAQRYEVPMSVLILDLDDFGRIAEQYGVTVAEKLLRAVSKSAAKTLRQFDIFGRIGMTRFAALLPQTELESAELAAGRLQKAISQVVVKNEDGDKIGTSLTVGVTTHDMLDLGIDDIMQRCVKALEEAKTKGPNSVIAVDYSR